MKKCENRINTDAIYSHEANLKFLVLEDTLAIHDIPTFSISC